MANIKFNAICKNFNKKSLVSGDFDFELKLRGTDPEMAKLVACPSDKQVIVLVTWEEENA